MVEPGHCSYPTTSVLRTLFSFKIIVAAMYQKTDNLKPERYSMLTGQILLQLIVILFVVQIFGTLCRHLGQQWVIGEILAGLAFGPSLLGTLLPGVKSMLFPASTLPTLQTLGDLGL